MCESESIVDKSVTMIKRILLVQVRFFVLVLPPILCKDIPVFPHRVLYLYSYKPFHRSCQYSEQCCACKLELVEENLLQEYAVESNGKRTNIKILRGWINLLCNVLP